MTEQKEHPRRKLIEVALPLEAISAANRADKDRKTGSIRNLHKWFAPMPSPAWRALLTAAIVDDPGDTEARRAILKKIEQLVPQNGSAPTESALTDARRLIEEAGRPTAVLDPFSGGGSTLVEAQRLGLPVIGSDLNPVATLITRFLTDVAPSVAWSRGLKDTERLAPDLRGRFEGIANDSIYYAELIRAKLIVKLAGLYPSNTEYGQPIGWLWAHTVICPNPACGVQVPLISSTTLLTQRRRHYYLNLTVSGRDVLPSIVQDQKQAGRPTKVPGTSAKFTCPAPTCNAGFGTEHIKAQVKSGLMTEQLLCTIYDSPAGRVFVEPGGVVKPTQLEPLESIPLIEIPDGALGFRVQPYGYRTYADLFTYRQQRALLEFAEAVSTLESIIVSDGGSTEYAQAVTTFLGICVGRMAQGMSRQVRWRVDPRSGSATAEATFSRQAIPMVWDYVETNPFGGSTGDWILQVNNAVRSFPHIPDSPRKDAVVALSDARHATTLCPAGQCLVATDPPYFDAIGYADLSGFFYPWLRIALKNVQPDLFTTISPPRNGELIADASRFGGSQQAAYEYFVSGFTEVFRRLSQVSDPSLPMIIIYAQKQEGATNSGAGTGWEALLEAMLEAGLMITGTWPIHGTGSTRQRILVSNALASYIVFTCRAGREKGGVTDRRNLLLALRKELPPSVRRLQEASIAPVDLSQASIGPGMAIFSRYASVVETDGSAMTVRTALALINQVLDEVLSEQEHDFDLETRFCTKWYGQFGWDEQLYGRADDLARSTNTAVEDLVRGGVFWAKAGKARLLRPDELSTGWAPATDDRTSAWEVVLRLAQELQTGGIDGASRLMARATQRIDLDTAKELAYLLYSICDKRRDTKSALLFNGLGTSWSDLSVAARAGGLSSPALDELDFDALEE